MATNKKDSTSPKTPITTGNLRLILDEPYSREDLKGNKIGCVEVKVGILPINYSKLYVPKNPTSEDKFVVVFELSKDERKLFIDSLAPLLVEASKLSGHTIKVEEAASTLKAKVKEIEEDSGIYRLQADQRVRFANSDHNVDVPILGPDNTTLEQRSLADGSEGMANFTVEAKINLETGKMQFPFRLRSVKVSTVVPYVNPNKSADGESSSSSNRKSHLDDFSCFESNY